AMTPLALMVLILTAPASAGAVAFAVLFGFNSGLKSIVQGTLPLALFGAGAYATRLGTMASARQTLAAVAPFVLAWASARTGPVVALMVLTGVAVSALAVFLEVARLCRLAGDPHRRRCATSPTFSTGGVKGAERSINGAFGPKGLHYILRCALASWPAA